MIRSIFEGELIRLAEEDSQTMASAFSRWNRDSEYFRMLDSAAPRLWSGSKIKDWIKRDLETASPGHIEFSIHTLAEDRLVGFIAFDAIMWIPRDAYVAIGIGERECWSKGYGTDAMRVMLRYGFTELNLHRVSLGVFESNPRAIRSYEKCGFVHEGRIRQFLLRDGKYWDMIQMGILRDEWEKSQR